MGREGRKSIVEQLYDKHYTLLYFFALSFLHDDEDAKDVVGEVFADLWTRWSGDNTVDLNLSYIYSMTRNRCIDRMRKKKVHVNYIRLAETVRYETQEEMEYFEMRLTKVREACGRLKEPVKTILWYCYFKKFTYRQTAEALGISLSSVKKAMQNAFSMLRCILREEL